MKIKGEGQKNVWSSNHEPYGARYSWSGRASVRRRPVGGVEFGVRVKTSLQSPVTSLSERARCQSRVTKEGTRPIFGHSAS